MFLVSGISKKQWVMKQPKVEIPNSPHTSFNFILQYALKHVLTTCDMIPTKIQRQIDHIGVLNALQHCFRLPPRLISDRVIIRHEFGRVI